MRDTRPCAVLDRGLHDAEAVNLLVVKHLTGGRMEWTERCLAGVSLKISGFVQRPPRGGRTRPISFGPRSPGLQKRAFTAMAP
eukprot:4659801-Prymnesium_polylepis.1